MRSGWKPPERQRVEAFQDGEIGALAVALVNDHRIDEAVRDHPETTLQRRLDRVQQVVAPRGRMEHGLGQRLPAFHGARDEKPSYLFGAGRAAGFARCERLDTTRFEGATKPRGLLRLAGTFAAFQRDEASARHAAVQ